MTVYLVAFVQVVLEDQEVGERHGEVVDLHVVEQVLFAVVDQFIEAAFGFLYVLEFEPGQALIEDHIWWLVIVEHCAGWFRESL